MNDKERPILPLLVDDPAFKNSKPAMPKLSTIPKDKKGHEIVEYYFSNPTPTGYTWVTNISTSDPRPNHTLGVLCIYGPPKLSNLIKASSAKNLVGVFVANEHKEEYKKNFDEFARLLGDTTTPFTLQQIVRKTSNFPHLSPFDYFKDTQS